MSGICSFLKSESIARHGLEGGLKAFKSFLKTKKGILFKFGLLKLPLVLAKARTLLKLVSLASSGQFFLKPSGIQKAKA